jgi:hypothetical protein
MGPGRSFGTTQEGSGKGWARLGVESLAPRRRRNLGVIVNGRGQVAALPFRVVIRHTDWPENSHATISSTRRISAS